MEKTRIRSAVAVIALVLACAGALFVQQRLGRDEHDAATREGPAKVGSGVPGEPLRGVQGAPEEPAAARESVVPVKLGSLGVPNVREYFTSTGYRFEGAPPDHGARAIGTSRDGQTVLEFIGNPALEQATLRYTLRAGALNGQDMAAIMYFMQNMKAEEADVAWGIEAARKGEPTTRTIGAVIYSVQRGPSGTNEFVMRPAPGFG